jgi:tRNA (guanine37-N1)-methyltransferase
MRFDLLTLFPELFAPWLAVGVTRRAFAADGPVQVVPWALRDFADDAYRRVDDRAYGGGPGMVMLVEPLERALAAARVARTEAGAPPGPVLLFSPAGQPLDQPRVSELAAGPGAVLVCGRYEGIDQRFIDRHVDEELSLGDFVLSGGEVPALALLDAVARLQPGVLNDAASHQQDSFSDGLLDCPHYSRPERLGDAPADAVPAVLLSGHHAEIARWRRQQQLALTLARRPDLIAAARAAGRLSAADEVWLKAARR